jgi:hypothetical protein
MEPADAGPSLNASIAVGIDKVELRTRQEGHTRFMLVGRRLCTADIPGFPAWDILTLVAYDASKRLNRI